MEQKTCAERLAAIVTGQAKGDAIGGPKTMASILLEEVNSSGGFDREAVMQRYLEWWRRDGFDTGPIAAEVFRRVLAGMEADASVVAVHEFYEGMTAGCAPVHRSVVLASVPFLCDEELELAVRGEATLTHFHPIAADVAVAAARIARWSADCCSWPEAVSNAAFGLADEVVASVIGWPEKPKDQGGYAPVVLHAALHFVGTGKSPEDVLRRSSRFSGRSNYVPVLAGAFAGAVWGQ